MNGARDGLKGELFVDVLKSTGKARLVLTGSSMLPSIRAGDMVEVQCTNVQEISKGDVVLCLRQGGFSAHRVVEKVPGPERTLLITRGDALREPDPPVSPEELLGRVTAVLRGGRRLSPSLTRRVRVASWLIARSEFCARVARRLWRP